MNYPKVSVIIPVYNGERYIAQAIESALSQTYKNFEIVVVNDGSTDNSYEQIKPYLPFIKYIYQENKGVAAARNTGIKNSSGELIGFLDQDDLWLPQKLELQVNYLIRNPDIGLVHSNRKYIYENGIKGPPGPAWPTKVSGMCFKALFVRNQISLLTTLVRRECLDRVGFFDEKLSPADDYELWLRISRSYPIGYVDHHVGFYRIHNQNISHDWVRVVLGDIKVIEKILNEFPEVCQELGNFEVRNKLYGLHYRMARLYLYMNNCEGARKYFWKALKVYPLKWDCWSNLLIWSFLTPKQRDILRWYKQRISKSLPWISQKS